MNLNLPTPDEAAQESSKSALVIFVISAIFTWLLVPYGLLLAFDELATRGQAQVALLAILLPWLTLLFSTVLGFFIFGAIWVGIGGMDSWKYVFYSILLFIAAIVMFNVVLLLFEALGAPNLFVNFLIVNLSRATRSFVRWSSDYRFIAASLIELAILLIGTVIGYRVAPRLPSILERWSARRSTQR